MLEKIKCKKTYLKKSDLTSGNAYRITLTHNGKKCSFIFNDNYLNKSNINDFVYCLLSDSGCYENSKNFDDFCYMFGYDSNSIKVLKIYEACKKQNEKVKRLFNDKEVQQLNDELYELGF